LKLILGQFHINQEVIELDMETRGIITKMIDDIVKNLEKTGAFKITDWFNEGVFMEDIASDWIAKDSKEMSTDLGTGYIVGYLACAAHHVIIDKKVNENLPKLTSEELQDFKKMTNREKLKFLKAKVTKAEVKEIRELIKPKIPRIRTAVYKTLSV
jgi:hypothetical protein